MRSSGRDGENLSVSKLLDHEVPRLAADALAAGDPEKAERIRTIRDRKAHPGTWAAWMSRNMATGIAIDYANCPDIGALTYLVECRNDSDMRADFWKQFAGRASKTVMESNDAEAFDGEIQTDLLDRIAAFREKSKGGHE